MRIQQLLGQRMQSRAREGLACRLGAHPPRELGVNVRRQRQQIGRTTGLVILSRLQFQHRQAGQIGLRHRAQNLQSGILGGFLREVTQAVERPGLGQRSVQGCRFGRFDSGS